MSKIWITKSSKKADEKPKGVVSPPVSYQTLINAYYSNPYHASAIDVKAINILGNGLKDDNINNYLADMAKEDSIFSLLEKTIRDFVLFGNAFWETIGGEIYHIPAWTMFRSESGWVQIVGKERVNFTLDDVWHFHTSSMLSSFYGTPSYLSILPSIELMDTITQYNSNFFVNNGIPDFAIITEGGVLSPAAEANIQRFLRSHFKGYENAHKTLYLPVPEGMTVKFEKLQSDSLKDMQFLELRNACIAEIIACHGVPPRLMSIQIPGSLGGTGEAEGEKQIFYQTRIRPLQNIFAGQLDVFFSQRLNQKTDIEFDSFDYSDNASDLVLKALRS